MFLFHYHQNDNIFKYFIIKLLTYFKQQNNFQNLKIYLIGRENDSFKNNSFCSYLEEDKINEETIKENKIKYVIYSYEYFKFWEKINTIIKFRIIDKLQNDNIHSIYLKELNKKSDNLNNYTLEVLINDFNLNEFNSFLRNIFKLNRTFGFINQNKLLLYRGNYENNIPLFQVKEFTSILEKNVIEEEPQINDKDLCFNTYLNNTSTLSKKNILKDPLHICLLGDWISSHELVKLWSRYCSDSENSIYQNIKLVNEDENHIDYYVVINRPKLTTKQLKIPSNKIIIFHMEPNMAFTPWYKEFLNKFSSKDLLFNGLHKYHRNNVDWHLSKNVKELFELKPEKNKDNRISMVLSNRRDNVGHQMRLVLAHILDELSEKDDLIKVDIYGLCKTENFKNYRKELPYYCRDEAIIPYKYHFMAENNAINNYMTEKILDCILSETLCFYYGCPNLLTFFHPDSFIRLPLHDPMESVSIIKNAIINNEWEKRVEIIRKEKLKILNIYNLLPRVQSILHLNTNMNIFILSNQDDVKINEFKYILEDQSFKNLRIIQSKGENISKENLKEILNQTNNQYDTFILNHNNYLDNKDNLIYERICDSITLIRQMEKYNNLTLFIKDSNKSKMYLQTDLFIPYLLKEKINELLNTDKKIEEIITSVPLNLFKYIY